MVEFHNEKKPFNKTQSIINHQYIIPILSHTLIILSYLPKQSHKTTTLEVHSSIWSWNKQQ